MTYLDYQKPPLRERINFRLIVFIAVVAAPILWVVYTFVKSEVTHGIEDAGNGYKQVDLKSMSNFTFDQQNGTQEDVPKIWRDLDGQKVVLVGEIAPTTFASAALKQFDLVYSRQKCCFSGQPLIQHFVQSQMKDGTAVEYYPDQVIVKGTLHVLVKHDAGKVSSIYQLDVESVDPVG